MKRLPINAITLEGMNDVHIERLSGCGLGPERFRHGPVVSTAFRWRHRFSIVEGQNPRKPAGTADALREAIELVVGDDIVPVSGAGITYTHCSEWRLPRSTPPVRRRTGPWRFHVRTVGNRHGQLEGFPKRCRGIATRYPDSYPKCFQQVAPHMPRQCGRQDMHTICKMSITQIPD